MYKSLFLESALDTNRDTYYRGRPYHMLINDNVTQLSKLVVGIIEGSGVKVEGVQIEGHDIFVKLNKPINGYEASKLYTILANKVQFYDFQMVETSKHDGKAETVATSDMIRISI
jgi:hypothetical protein